MLQLMGKDETARDIYEMGLDKVPAQDPQFAVGDKTCGVDLTDR